MMFNFQFSICHICDKNNFDQIKTNNTSGEPSICQYCKMSMMQNDNDANCQLFKYVNVAKCQWLLNVNTKLNE